MTEEFFVQLLLYDIFVILTAGFCAGALCRRFAMPMVVGYLIVGAMIGPGVFNLLTPTPDEKDVQPFLQQSVDADSAPPVEVMVKEGEGSILYEEGRLIEGLALLGANLLLFSIGIHFSPSELSRVWHFFLCGGTVQMLGVIVPAWLIGSFLLGDWKSGLLIGAAVSLSSTVLVFKSLEDFGQSMSPHGLRAVAILLFQDVMTVPLLVLIGLLTAIHTGTSNAEVAEDLMVAFGVLIKEAVLFTLFVVALRYVFVRFGVSMLAQQKSVELLILFTLLLIIGVTSVGLVLNLPSALGALAAGFILSETRLTKSIAAVTIPMRETFAVIFFVSLGALFVPTTLINNPASTMTILLACIFGKTFAAGIAFRVLGLPWIPAFAMGLGLSQLGELSFILLSQGSSAIGEVLYQQVLFVAMVTMILTPFLLKLALQWSSPHLVSEGVSHQTHSLYPDDDRQYAIVIGLGPVGSRIVSFLEMSGFDVCLIDMNPVNVHAYAQQGFRTVAGNATDPKVLEIAKLSRCSLVIVTVPSDQIAQETVQVVREQNRDCIVVVRCHYTVNANQMESLGANLIVCEESEAGGAIVRGVQRMIEVRAGTESRA
ncbi:MAG: cation:proton antiporter [Thermoguttaceae bacterium]